MRSSASKIQLTSYDELFSGGEEDSSSGDGVREIALSELHPFKSHPFKVLDDGQMQKLVDSIKENGVLSPAVVRPCSEGGYEIISGHRRKRACEIIGLKTMPAIIRKIDDDQAVISMVDSNLQRETLLPSERAFAYKMKLEAMKRQGKRSDLTCAQLGHKLSGIKSRDILAEQVGESRNQIQRYIRLTELIPPLLDKVDDKKIAFNTAVELSYLKQDEQAALLNFIQDGAVPTLFQAQRLKQFSREDKLNADTMEAILSESNAGPQKITIHREKLSKYFPPSYTSEQMENVIFNLLEEWKSKGDSSQ
jgi:ParB family chromosome partitioning protein